MVHDISEDYAEHADCLECDDCGDAYSGARAIRSELREVDVVGGTQFLCLACIDDRRKIPHVAGGVRPKSGT